MHKKIFVLNGHPAATSLNRSLAERYVQSARDAGHEVRTMHLNEMQFDPDFEHAGYREIKPLEPALEKLMTDIEWSEHVVLVAPMWWGGLPGKLKGMFDRALLPGRAFDTRVPAGQMPKPMLSGRSGRVIMTSDTPRALHWLLYRSAVVHQVRKQILGFIGIKPARVTYFAGASHAKPGLVDKWLGKAAHLGRLAA